jgi:hypothetical protein
MASYQRASIRVALSRWSDPVPLQGSSIGSVDVRDKETTTEFQLGIQTRPAPGQFWRTTLVTFSNRFMLVNRSPMPLYYRQDSQLAEHEHSRHPPALPEFLLPPGQQIPFHWSSSIHRRYLNLREEDGVWSKAVPIDAVGMLELRLRKRGSSATNVLRAEIGLQDATGVIALSYNASQTSYKINNLTDEYALVVNQVGEKEQQRVLPHDKQPFCWENLLTDASRRVHLQIQHIDTGKVLLQTEVELDEFSRRRPCVQGGPTSGPDCVLMEVKAEGPCKVLEISQPPAGRRKLTAIALGSAYGDRPAADTLLLADETPPPLLQFSLNMVGLGISLIDKRPQELMYVFSTLVDFFPLLLRVHYR